MANTGLGLVSSIWLDALDGPPLRHRLVLHHLVSARRPAAEGMTALRVTGARSGRAFRFPMRCAPLGSTSLVVLPDTPERTTWWRGLDRASDVAVLDGGDWVPSRARVVAHGSVEWSVARSAYVARRPRANVPVGPLVVVDLRRAPVAQDAQDAQSTGDQGPVEPGRDAVGGDALRP
jgi:hypothetical protein